ncbi:MAG: hypothetical protein R3C61_04740 [Bacteroidia bacterium]
MENYMIRKGCILGVIWAALSMTGFAQKVLIPLPDPNISVYPLQLINSPCPESGLAISPDGEYLIFASSRGGNPWNEPFKGSGNDTLTLWDKDLWISHKYCGEWQPPQSLPHGINTSLSEDEPFVAADGKTLFFQSWNYLWEQTGGPYYQTRFHGNNNPPITRGMGTKLTSLMKNFDQTGGISLTPDKKTLWLVAGKPGQAQMDIYSIQKIGRKWKKISRSPLSTPENERSIFILEDGQTLFFASSGYEGFGGLDIYQTTLDENGQPGVIINLGPEVNTAADEFGFVTTGCGEEAYFIREGNVYCVDFRKTSGWPRP